MSLDVRAGRGVDHLQLLVLRQVVDQQAEHEAVLLDLRQRIGAFLLDGVLRGQHEERLVERDSVLPPTVTWCSCMASSRAAWVLGGVRLISSASRMLVKIGPGRNRSCRSPVARSSSSTSVPVMSAGIRSGVNWTRRELQVHRLAQAGDQQRLGQARHARDQAVPAGEERR